MSYWKKERPSVPNVDQKYSEWVWFWGIGEKEPWVMQLWPGRDISRLDGLWGEKINLPTNMSVKFKPASKNIIVKNK